MSTKECGYFGCLTEKLGKTKRCRRCVGSNASLHKKCEKATALEESISIIIVKGKTRRVRGPLTAFGKAKSEVSTPQQKESTSKKARQKQEKEASVRLPRVPGVIAFCVELMGKGENETVIQALLTEKYVRAGYPKNKAAARAVSIYRGQVREQKKK
jgi:hypothetical protein